MSRASEKRFWYVTWANVVAWAHFAWTMLVFWGTVAVVFDHAYAPIQAGVILVAIAVNGPFPSCPLTLLEEKLRKESDASYQVSGSFMAKHLNELLGTSFTPRMAKAGIAIFYVISSLLTIFALTHR